MDLLKSPVRVSLLALLLAGTLFLGGSLQPRHTANADNPGVAAHLHIDADTTNGVCNPIDTTRTVSSGVAFSVALCLQDANLAPISGGFNTATIDVGYTGVSATNLASDLGTDLASNPNWNEGGFLAPPAWDCNLVNAAGGRPLASPSPAKIVCATDTTGDAQPVTVTVLLATLNLDAFVGSVTADFTWGAGTTSLVAGAVESFCGAEIVCTGASVTIGGGGAAPTATNTAIPTNTPPPTSTSTPCVVLGATCTPVSQVKHTVTPTPTVATPTAPPPADTPVPGQAAQPPAPAGAPRGTIRLPDTGSGPAAREGLGSLQGALVVLAVAGALAISGGTFARTRSRGRGN